MREGSPAEVTHDPYRFNSRLINLAHLLGYTVHLNCRSGKDRTGIIDAEAKYVAEALDVAVTTNDSAAEPNFQRRLYPREQTTIFHYAMTSGSVAIQRHCTGVPGSLLQPILSEMVAGDPLANRIGEENWVYFRGLSRFAGS
jgi:phosphatidylinositol-4,5-bisphosphate 4-phosphatase